MIWFYVMWHDYDWLYLRLIIFTIVSRSWWHDNWSYIMESDSVHYTAWNTVVTWTVDTSPLSKPTHLFQSYFIIDFDPFTLLRPATHDFNHDRTILFGSEKILNSHNPNCCTVILDMSRMINNLWLISVCPRRTYYSNYQTYLLILKLSAWSSSRATKDSRYDVELDIYCN